MKEKLLSNCERSFILETIKQNKRLDGRKNEDFREVKIYYGGDWGSSLVEMGKTKVVCQVSCEMGIPKATRPNEGIMFINVDLGPMAAPHFEAGRNSEVLVTLNRTLERTFKDSKCVDLESLCIKAEERVWILRVDLNVLNHEGNLLDCCSIAALSALGHFRKPDVSIIDNEVHVHTSAEKDHIPLVLHHYPICVSYCTFEEGKIAVADPNWMEEKVASSSLVFGLNSFRELCCLNLGGSSLTSPTLLIQSANRASKHAQEIVEMVRKSWETDSADRDNGICKSFVDYIKPLEPRSDLEDLLLMKIRAFNLKHRKNLKSEPTSNDDSLDMMPKKTPSANQKKKAKKKERQFKQEAAANQAQNLTSWLPEESMELDVKQEADSSAEDDEFDSKTITEQLEESQKLKQKIGNVAVKSEEEEDSNSETTDEEDDSDEDEEDTVML